MNGGYGAASSHPSVAQMRADCERVCLNAREKGWKLKEETHEQAGVIRFVWLRPNGAQRAGEWDHLRERALWRACQV